MWATTSNRTHLRTKMSHRDKVQWTLQCDPADASKTLCTYDLSR
jgi:hypothetical protein